VAGRAVEGRLAARANAVRVDALLRSGIPFELAGLVYFVFYLVMSRNRFGRFSRRSKILTLIAAIAMVASVPLNYGANPVASIGMLGLAALAFLSNVLDARSR
jgi:hypothetical protein